MNGLGSLRAGRDIFVKLYTVHLIGMKTEKAEEVKIAVLLQSHKP